MKGITFQTALILGFFVVFVFAFNGGSAASPYVTDLIVTAHSGGLKCDYTLGETPETGDRLTTATAWYCDDSPLMVLYLPFEGGAINSLLDYSGNSATVTIYGEWSDPTWIPDGGHDGGGAYEFDGNDAFDAGNIFPVRSSYTKTAWIYREVMGEEPWWNNIISGHSHEANNHCFRVDNTGILGAGHNGGTMTVTDPETIEFETWYFVAVTFDYDTGAMRLYKNGVLVDSDTVPEEYQKVTDRGVYIGRMEIDWMWQGKLDDCRIYDYALTGDQIQAMYESGSNLIAPSEVIEWEKWYAEVTPFSSTEAGDTQTSNTWTIGDDDSDGVPNADDLCPDTPEGEDVDENGCSLSQLDSDSDGVTDDLDQCPYTPEGVTVDVNGCSLSQLDTDGDGINDDADSCPGTPEGASVDENGCSLSQLDSDNDGVTDDLDQCPYTPEGVTVDENGCSLSQLDTDGDGINDDADSCPGTSEGASVDANGCSLSQLDSDSDGVTDDIDNCPDTSNLDQADLDGDGTGDVCDDDVDGDDVPDDEELGPYGELDYDGNGDGTPDRLQPNVVSGFTYDDESYVTLAVTAPIDVTLTDVQPLAPPAELPEGTEFPYGVFAFTIENVAAGGPATVTLHLPDGESPDTYYKYGLTLDNQSDHWYEFMYDGITGAQINDNVITLHFVDGARGDDDLTADGEIMDDGAPASNTAPIIPEAAGGGGGGGGCFISTGTFSSHAAVQLTRVLLFGFALISLARLELNRDKK